MPIQIGQKLSVVIEKLSLGGDGIARVPSLEGGISNFVVFVPYSAPGEEVEIRIMEKKRNFARGLITRIIRPSPERIEPACSYFYKPGQRDWCGGCNFQQLNYPFQVQEKTRAFKETLEKIAGTSSESVLPAMGAPPGREWRYRNKIQLPIGRNVDGIITGFYAPSSHRIVPIDDCLIQPEPMMTLVRFIRGRMRAWRLESYSEKSHCGWLRHLFVRQSEATGKMLLVFVTANGFFPRGKEWVIAIRKSFPLVVGIAQNVNPDRTNVILGKKWVNIFGGDFLMEKLEGLGPEQSALKLKVSAASFFQVNTSMAQKLYQLVRDFAIEENSPGGTLLDLYTGVGGIALSCAAYFQNVIGVDETPSSINDAKENQAGNGIKNCTFLCSSVKDHLKKLESSDFSRPFTVVLDPPRAGCEEEVLREIIRLLPDKIVYVSCEPSTLARDVKILREGGYNLKKVQPVDLFPQSSHIESISLLTR